jgi:uncharacterized membrane protein
MGIQDLSWLARGVQDTSRRTTYIRLLAPPLVAVIFFLWCILILSWNRVLILGGLMIAYFIPPSGKESIIPIGIGLGIPWWLMALTLTLLDVITALFMIMNFALMLRVPRLGPWIEKTTATSREFIAERPWMNRWRIPGLAFFVMLPLQGTGGVGATVVGLMIGLTPGEILLAVGIGAAVESLAFAIGWGLVRELILANLILGLVAAFMVIIGTILLFVFIRRRFTWSKGKDKKEL